MLFFLIKISYNSSLMSFHGSIASLIHPFLSICATRKIFQEICLEEVLVPVESKPNNDGSVLPPHCLWNEKSAAMLSTERPSSKLSHDPNMNVFDHYFLLQTTYCK